MSRIFSSMDITTLMNNWQIRRNCKSIFIFLRSCSEYPSLDIPINTFKRYPDESKFQILALAISINIRIICQVEPMRKLPDRKGVSMGADRAYSERQAHFLHSAKTKRVMYKRIYVKFDKLSMVRSRNIVTINNSRLWKRIDIFVPRSEALFTK